VMQPIRSSKRIDGVDPSSMVGLQAALYRSEQRRKGLGGPGTSRTDKFHRKNPGVELRDERVLGEERAAHMTAARALDRKSSAYARIVRGEEELLPDGEHALVDFERKRWEEASMLSEDMRRDLTRRRWEADALMDTKSRGATDDEPRHCNKDLLSEVAAEASLERERHATTQLKRERDLADRRQAIAAKRRAPLKE